MGNAHGIFDFTGGSYGVGFGNLLILFGSDGRGEAIPETPVYLLEVSISFLPNY